MNENLSTYKSASITAIKISHLYFLGSFFAGILIPLSFAPFHLPGMAILGMALLYAQLINASLKPLKQSLLLGFVFGLGFFSFGVSWVYVSIHEYGHLNLIFSAIITLIFIAYLALYPAIIALAYRVSSLKNSRLFSALLFSATWCLGEYLRSSLMGGFPWLLLGTGQVDTPLGYLLPIIGIYGASFLTCFVAACLVISLQTYGTKRYFWLAAFIVILLSPLGLKDKAWTTLSPTPLTIAIIQNNLSMRDKWDEALFWQIIHTYQQNIETLVKTVQLIVMPESAIPLPATYLNDFIDAMHKQAQYAKSSLLIGIPQATNLTESNYYNTLIGLGLAHGNYLKQQLVPFGEYTPAPFEQLSRWLALPAANLKPGHDHQLAVQVGHYSIATLICYELAYPKLLRKQLPQARWVVSISDDGWFGHSLAIYQHLQMAQTLSMQTGRFQVVANNDGLSSVIDAKGQIVASLAAFSAGILKSELYPATGSTPWVNLGDTPILFISALILVLALISRLYTHK